MFKIPALCGAAFLCFALSKGDAQSVDSVATRVGSFPTHLLGRIRQKVANLNSRLTSQTEGYLSRMASQEERMRQRLAKTDSAGAASLFGGSAQRYAELEQRMRTDTGGKGRGYSGIYPAYLDSLNGSVSFLKQNPTILSNTSAGTLTQLQGANMELQTFRARMGDADEVKSFLQQRKQQVAAYIAQHAAASGLSSKGYASMNQGVYYYSQQLREYKEMWSNPDELTQKALTVLNRLPAFQTFMKNNSMLGGLFHLPGGYGGSQSVSGLQNKEQIAALITAKTGGAGNAGVPPGGASGGASGSGGMDGLQSNVQTAESKVEAYQSKLSALGAGNGDIDLPDFKPNDQKTKTFWKRLEYGANFQTTHTDYYFPMVTDFGASLGYKLGHNNVVGVGASYKLGWGNGIQHVALSNQGVGLRSFLQIGIKGSFSATGGFEYNYTTPFASFQNLKLLQDWTKSGLVGVTKTISLKNRTFKKTSVSLLWDFLSYQQVPQTQPILFRIGYSFN